MQVRNVSLQPFSSRGALLGQRACSGIEAVCLLQGMLADTLFSMLADTLFSMFSSLQVAVCNLASIALNMYVTSEHTYDFKKLAEVTKVIVRNLNKIIDINYYPVPEVSAVLHCYGADGSPGAVTEALLLSVVPV